MKRHNTKSKFLKVLIALALVLSLGVAPITALASDATYILKVTGDWVRMRSEPVPTATVTNYLREGDKVLYLGDGGNYQCRVMTIGGQIGYVYRGYLTVYGAVNKNRIAYNTSPAALYVRDGESLSYVATLPAGQFVLVNAVNGNWLYVKLINGKTCYMRSDTLSKIG